MADGNLKQLQSLFDHNLRPLRKKLEGVNKRLDLVAGHLAGVDEGLSKVQTTLGERAQQLSHQDEQLDRIERQLSKHLDRFDEHDERIDALEAKTAHLPKP